jgi:hypothetical protein
LEPKVAGAAAPQLRAICNPNLCGLRGRWSHARMTPLQQRAAAYAPCGTVLDWEGCRTPVGVEDAEAFGPRQAREEGPAAAAHARLGQVDGDAGEARRGQRGGGGCVVKGPGPHSPSSREHPGTVSGDTGRPAEERQVEAGRKAGDRGRKADGSQREEEAVPSPPEALPYANEVLSRDSPFRAGGSLVAVLGSAP